MCRVQSEEQRLRENLNQEFHSMQQQMNALNRRLHYLYLAIEQEEMLRHESVVGVNHLLYAATMTRLNAHP